MAKRAPRVVNYRGMYSGILAKDNPCVRRMRKDLKTDKLINPAGCRPRFVQPYVMIDGVDDTGEIQMARGMHDYGQMYNGISAVDPGRMYNGLGEYDEWDTIGDLGFLDDKPMIKMGLVFFGGLAAGLGVGYFLFKKKM